MTDEELALAEQVIRAAVRRHRLSAAHADDFAGFVRLRLIEGRTFEKFQQRSSLRTFLTTVVERLYLDFRNQEWGKWRPSVEARRLGELAVRLEMLLTREGLRFDEAYETLRTAHQITETRDDLYAMSLRFPRRNPRRVVGEDALNDHPDPGTPDLCVLETELHSVAGRLAAALERALQDLDPGDRLVLKMQFYDGMTLADVARVLGKPQKPLYRSVERLLGDLRAKLESQGFTAEEVAELLGRDFPSRRSLVPAEGNSM